MAKVRLIRRTTSVPKDEPWTLCFGVFRNPPKDDKPKPVEGRKKEEDEQQEKPRPK